VAKLRQLIFSLLFVSAAYPVLAQFGPDTDFVKIEVFSSLEKVYKNSEVKFAIKADVDEGWHINSNKPNEDFLIPSGIELLTDVGFEIISTKYPEAKELEFGFSDKPVSVFEGEFLIGAIIRVPSDIEFGDYELTIKFGYQACNDMTCMPPNTVEQKIQISVVDIGTASIEQNSEIFSQMDLSYTNIEKKEDGSIGDTLESSGLFLSLLIVFLGGLALNLTPCVYPLIPITVGYFGGQSEGSTKKLFLLGLLYVLGMAITYSVVGVVTSLSGAVFGGLLQSPIVIIAVVGILLALSLSMFGVYEFKLPDSWVMKAGGAKAGVAGAFFMGLTMGIVAAPCIGPFVIGLVTYVAAKGDPVYGFLMFFFMAVGLGLPYLFLALFSGKIKALPKAGFWMEAVKHIFGFLLIGMAIYFLGPLLPKVVNHYLLPVFMILAALYLLFMDKLANNILGFRIFKIVFSIIFIGIAVFMLWPVEKDSPDWQTYSDTAYEQALESNQKIIIDFYADWCIPCKELDALTFSDERVVELSKEFVCLKVDMTKTMSDETEIIRKKFEIIGMPTVLIIDSKGKEVDRITGFLSADDFLTILKKTN